MNHYTHAYASESAVVVIDVQLHHKKVALAVCSIMMRFAHLFFKHNQLLY